MSKTSFSGSEFIEKAEAIILDNISNEQFGVSELAGLMNMSRSSLLRKIKTHTQLSASQFIRQVRLTKSMEMLKLQTMTVSEVSYEVGFGNTSYFIKCFREQYGYSPGEVGKRTEDPKSSDIQVRRWEKYRWHLISAAALIIAALTFLVFNKEKANDNAELVKSIAVLPFKNESSDTMNRYFVNGLMESTLNNLQKIGDLRVISRTSAAKFENTKKSIPEIAEELNVNYLVEGSGQRIGNQVSLHIQLIEGAGDQQVWAGQYNREVEDVFALQNEVAKQIADAIEAVVTPAELKQIEKKPTEDLLAYDYYLQALDPFHEGTKEGLEKAIPLFKKAIEYDRQFALAYADIAIAFYFLDMSKKEKQFSERINNFADKALLYDSKSAESLIAKALYYLQIEEYKLAVPHLEKAMEYNPNSSAVVQILADLYARVIPNTDKYLEYALQGIQLNVSADDSTTKSYIYLHLSNALIQNAFVDEALTYINKSLDYNPSNYYAPMLKAFILFAGDGNIMQTKNLLFKEWVKDTTRLDILQEVAKIHYFQEDYDSAYFYYKIFSDARERNGLDIYPSEDAKISLVYKKQGLDAQAQKLFDAYENYCEKDQSIYKSASMAVKYSYEGNISKAVEQLKIFATQDNYQYWILLFLEKDPLLKPMKKHPEFEGIIKKIKDRFWKNHAKLRKKLKEKRLI